MLMAEQASKRSTCSRLQVGAVVVQDRQVVGTGYNGAPSGIPHCVHVDDTPCDIAVHAEANAVLFAGRMAACFTREMYVTHAPCVRCAGLIINAEIDAVFYRDTYRSEKGLVLLRDAEVRVERVS
jgi:dCMP deaminase